MKTQKWEGEKLDPKITMKNVTNWMKVKVSCIFSFVFNLLPGVAPK